MIEKRKIAVLMIVHKNEAQVNRLIEHLSKDFDIYVHIDKKTLLKFSATKDVFVYKKFNIYWGSFNQIKATLFLFKKAFVKGYERYILISGQDLPIKTNKEIKTFFENNNTEYIDIEKIPRKNNTWPNMNRLTRYYFYYKNPAVSTNKYIKKITILFCRFLSNIKPRKLDYDFHGGASWINLTHSGLEKIFKYLDSNPKYINRFKWTHCADEIFYQTIVSQLDGLVISNDCLRYINWCDGPKNPKILRKLDYENIITSKAIFARKFDYNVDKEIIERVYSKIQ